MDKLDRYLLSWTRIFAAAFIVHAAAFYASWAVNGGFSGPTWIAMASLVFFMHETATRSPAYPDRYINMFRRSKVSEISAGVCLAAAAFFTSLGVIISLFL